MGAALLSLHVLAAIIFIGPVTVAVSLFPRYARLALLGHAPVEARVADRMVDRVTDTVTDTVADPHGGDGVRVGAAEEPERDPDRERATGVALLLHRISRVYAVLGLSVPVLGIALAVRLGVLTDAWLLVSIALTAAAAALLAAVVLPAQHDAVALMTGTTDEASRGARVAWTARVPRLAMSSGVFSLLWAVVVVLMVVRPGSTTGV